MSMWFLLLQQNPEVTDSLQLSIYLFQQFHNECPGRNICITPITDLQHTFTCFHTSSWNRKDTQASTFISVSFHWAACLFPCPFLWGQQMIAFCMCVDVDADSSPVVVASVKALIWRIIQGVLTHPSNTQGVTGGWEVWNGLKNLSLSLCLAVRCAAGLNQGIRVKVCITNHGRQKQRGQMTVLVCSCVDICMFALQVRYTWVVTI